MKKSYKPGEISRYSGQFELVGPRGGKTNREVTVVKGEPIPPTPKPGMKYVLVDETKHAQ